MKLLIATDSFLPRWDGIARFLSEIIPRLDSENEVKVLAPDFIGEYDDKLLVEVTRIELSKLKVADYPLPKFKHSEIKKKVAESDVVWTQTIGPIGSLAIIAGSNQKKKVVAYIHSIEWELFPESLQSIPPVMWTVRKSTMLIGKYLYNKCDLLLVPSQKIADIMTKQGIKTPMKMVPLGTNTKIFTPPDSKAAAKKAIGIDPKRLVVGFAGRIGKEKDLTTLYRAFSRIHRKHDAILLIVGQDMGGITKSLESNPKVKIVGTTNNIEKYLQAMDVYVLPSLTETSSLSTIEAMSTKLAVISTPVGAIKDYIKDGFNGLLFKPGDAYELSKKIDKLLSDEMMRKTLGDAARRTVIDRFSWEKTASELKIALDDLQKIK